MQSMLSIFPTIATILGALCFCTVDLPAQSLDDAKPSSVSTGAPDKGDPGVKVGFFSDEVVQDSELERIPAIGDQLRWKTLDIEVVDMDGRRIDRLLIRSIPASAVNEKRS